MHKLTKLSLLSEPLGNQRGRAESCSLPSYVWQTFSSLLHAMIDVKGWFMNISFLTTTDLPAPFPARYCRLCWAQVQVTAGAYKKRRNLFLCFHNWTTFKVQGHWISDCFGLLERLLRAGKIRKWRRIVFLLLGK